jgi:hypothetical protein
MKTKVGFIVAGDKSAIKSFLCDTDYFYIAHSDMQLNKCVCVYNLHHILVVIYAIYSLRHESLYIHDKKHYFFVHNHFTLAW